MILLLVLIILAVVIFLLDCDFVLKWYEVFGPKPENILRGKVVWITGASSGIGECLATELARCGCKLALSARRIEELERVKEQCASIAQEKFAGTFDKDKDILVAPLDLTKFDTHEKCMQTILTHFNKIDILVNNGGRSQRGLVFETKGLAVDKAMMDLNGLGPISLTKTVLPHMLERQEGQIIVMSSVSGKLGVPAGATYCATKFALQGYFESLRMEVFDKNINITLICPGPVVSNVVQNAFTEDVNVSYKNKAVVKHDPKRMPTLRCVKLMMVGIANKLDEIWIAPNPVLFFTYASQYIPFVYTALSKRLGIKQVQKMRDETEGNCGVTGTFLLPGNGFLYLLAVNMSMRMLMLFKTLVNIKKGILVAACLPKTRYALWIQRSDENLNFIVATAFQFLIRPMNVA